MITESTYNTGVGFFTFFTGFLFIYTGTDCRSRDCRLTRKAGLTRQDSGRSHSLFLRSEIPAHGTGGGTNLRTVLKPRVWLVGTGEPLTAVSRVVQHVALGTFPERSRSTPKRRRALVASSHLECVQVARRV